MTLRFTNRHMLHFGTGSLLIEAVDGKASVTCRVSRALLGDPPGDDETEDFLWAAYRRQAAAIQAAERRKYAAGEREPDGSLFVGSTDL